VELDVPGSSLTFCVQSQAIEKKEATNRFAIEEEDDDVASAAELTFFQASAPRHLHAAAAPHDVF
jgi:hypothetical protein